MDESDFEPDTLDDVVRELSGLESTMQSVESAVHETNRLLVKILACLQERRR